ncbi:6,7-dimethyl-8-ribityllumazine synthase [Candidatus Peregrinibacteria bacterium HGW-Peregrinibacteria-1]|jgi:6,7-dimethyl-8-ribityllumazine synthase|nr:MAG: 6,7-dimethyl-8-ribityllumazine synthase [Candidatus Peregrinibacteria bacterium HGW-Peregrinibacteria-1]
MNVDDKAAVSDVAGKGLKVVVLASRFNGEYVDAMVTNCITELLAKGVSEDDVVIKHVGGSLELPYAVKVVAAEIKPDVVIALGVVVRGETTHYDLVSEITYQGLMQVQLNGDIPVIFGVLTCENFEQVEDRVSSEGQNKGAEFAVTAILQANLK